MSTFYFVLDTGVVEKISDELQSVAEAALAKGGAALAAATYSHLVDELANKKLHTRRQQYIDALSFNQVNETTWVINLDKKARWIEDGMQKHSMIDSLLRSPKAKRAKDGSRYLSVPFEHKKGPTQQTKAANDLTNTIKNFLAAYNKKNPDAKIPYGKVETHANGVPKFNMSNPEKPMLLHSFSIMDKPLKTHHGPGQGKGPIGAVRQGPTGIPFLQNIRVYQKMVKDPKTGKQSVHRSIVTFRTVSSKHKGTGRWEHPGLEAMNLMDKAVEWALQEWDTKIRDQILAEVKNSI